MDVEERLLEEAAEESTGTPPVGGGIESVMGDGEMATRVELGPGYTEYA